MTRQLIMADRWTGDDVEAEPVIISVESNRIRFELDDGDLLDVALSDIVAAIAREDQAA